MKRLALLLLLLPTLAFAQTNCPGSTHLGWGQGNDFAGHFTNLYVSFPNAAGTATLNGPFEWDADDIYQTCNPTTWNANTHDYYGTVSYNDGTVSYTGAARFWIDFAWASTPACVPDKDYVPRVWMVRRLKIQSCTNSHTLTNRFIAVSCDGSYCEVWVGPACTNSGGYYHSNSINLTVSGF